MPVVGQDLSKGNLSDAERAANDALAPLNLNIQTIRSLSPDQQIQELSRILSQFASLYGMEKTFAETFYNALQNNDVKTLQALETLFAVLHSGTPNAAQEAIIQMGRDALERGDAQSFQDHMLFLSAFNQAVTKDFLSSLSEAQQERLARFILEHIDMELFRSQSLDAQKDTIKQVLDLAAREGVVQMSEESCRNIASSITVTMQGELRGADAATMANVWGQHTMDGLLGAATYLTISERNSITSFLEGPAAAMLYSPIEQQLLMMETYLEALRNFGLEAGKEEEKLERELEEYREEREKLSSELEEARTKFARELSEMGDEGGLNFLAQALEGNANPGSAEWNEFWTKERVAAFRRAVRG